MTCSAHPGTWERMRQRPHLPDRASRFYARAIMHVLDERTAGAVRGLCDLIVPGSARVWPEVYIDAVLALMPQDDREVILGAFAALEPVAGSTEELATKAATPEFAMARAFAVEAFYSDFIAPGAPGPGAYDEIDFTIPLAKRIDKDWSYLLGATA
jgi:hypothetical protein